MQHEFDSLADRMHRICGRSRIYFFENEGNWGDALIRAGTLRFLRHYGFDLIELTSNRQKLPPFAWFRSNVLIYGGGGGWCSLWNHAHAILQRQARHFDQIVVLPSTFEHAYELENATFFCRDRFESQEAMPEATFCHDMAFFLGRQYQSTGEGTGSFFRTDPESSGRVEIPDGNCDLSCEGDHRRAIDPFFDRIAAFRVIRTDRLHVAIAACLLGRELHFYPGSYFKNRAVFLSSMEGRFEGVTFHSV